MIWSYLKTEYQKFEVNTFWPFTKITVWPSWAYRGENSLLCCPLFQSDFSSFVATSRMSHPGHPILKIVSSLNFIGSQRNKQPFGPGIKCPSAIKPGYLSSRPGVVQQYGWFWNNDQANAPEACLVPTSNFLRFVLKVSLPSLRAGAPYPDHKKAFLFASLNA